MYKKGDAGKGSVAGRTSALWPLRSRSVAGFGAEWARATYPRAAQLSCNRGARARVLDGGEVAGVVGRETRSNMRPAPVPPQAFARRGLMRSLLALPLAIRIGQWPPLPVQATGLQRQPYSSSDGACYFSVPPDWRLVELCSPDRVREQCEATGRRVIVAARSPDGRAVATVTVDLGAYGKKLTDFASLQTISEGTLAAFEGSTLREATEVASRGGSLAPNYYVLRFEHAGRFEHVVKLTVRQSRLYTLTIRAEAPPPALRAELESILSSFDAFPVSSLRGGLLSEP